MKTISCGRIFNYSNAQSVCMFEMDGHSVNYMRHIDDYLGNLQ